MAEVTASTTEIDIINALAASLGTATISGVDVFADVHVSLSEEFSFGTQFISSPLVVVQYINTEEFDLTDLRRGRLIKGELILAAKKNTQQAATQEVFRLMNVAKNAIFATPPSDAEAFSTQPDDDLHRAVVFGEPETDNTSNHPWSIMTLPFEIANVIANVTSH